MEADGSVIADSASLVCIILSLIRRSGLLEGKWELSEQVSCMECRRSSELRSMRRRSAGVGGTGAEHREFHSMSVGGPQIGGPPYIFKAQIFQKEVVDFCLVSLVI